MHFSRHMEFVEPVRPLHVLHVTPYGGAAWAYGGIPRLSDVMVRGMAARGHHITLCITDACDAARRLPAAGRFQSLAQRRSRVLGCGIELRVFPNVSNWLAYHHQLFLPIGLSGYFKRHG